MAFAARRTGTCLKCNARIELGDQIEKQGSVYVHQHCPASAPKLFNADQDAAVTFLRGIASPDAFQASLLDQFNRVGRLSDNQIAAVMRSVAKQSGGLRIALPGADVVPAARYAVKMGEKELVVRVWRGNRNPNVVKCYDDDQGIEVNSRRVLEAIVAQDPIKCAMRYGQLRQRCSKCDRRLSQKLSVELSVGPECLKYWHGEERAKALRAAARAVIRARGEDPNEVVAGSQVEAVADLIVRAPGTPDPAQEVLGSVVNSFAFKDEWIEHKNAFAAREREQERRAFMDDPY